MTRRLRWAVALTGAGALAACSTSPNPAPVLLTLPPAALAPSAAAPGPAASGAAATAAPLLAVRRVNIPEYLVARRVRYRADASTLAEWPNTYWAERIEVGVSREFVSALRQQLPGWSLCDTNCGDQVPEMSLQLDLVPMDYLRSAKVLKAGARITLFGSGVAPKVLQVQEQAHELPSPADTAQGQAQAMAALIQQAAATAAAAIKRTPTP